MFKANILIIEDDKSFHYQFSRILKNEKYNVECTMTGERAITKIRENNFLTIKLSKDIDCESLFALYNKAILIGVIIYILDSKNNNIKIVYMAIDEKHTMKGIFGDKLLTLKMIDYLKSIAKRKNILTISIDYGISKTVIKV